MPFLVDANLPRLVVALLRSLGHHVEFARDIGLAAAPDRDIAARARLTGAVLLTRDLDFADTRQYPPDLIRDWLCCGSLRMQRRAPSPRSSNDLFAIRTFSLR